MKSFGQVLRTESQCAKTLKIYLGILREVCLFEKICTDHMYSCLNELFHTCVSISKKALRQGIHDNYNFAFLGIFSKDVFKQRLTNQKRTWKKILENVGLFCSVYLEQHLKYYLRREKKYSGLHFQLLLWCKLKIDSKVLS